MTKKLRVYFAKDMAETKSSPAAESLQLTSSVTSYDPEKASQLCFKGIPYSSIIKEYWSLNGGEPQEGERNVKLHQLAVNLRAICDNNVELILQIIPRYGLPEDETRRIVASACKEEPKGISTKMKSIIKKLQSKPASEPDYNAEEPAPVATPLKYLPIGLKETLAGLPANMHMPVLCSIMPLAATYADGVKVEYLDGNMQRLGLMAIIRGEQASNKTVCKNAIEIWKKPLEREDAEARKLEDKWREKKRNRKANEKIPDDPKVCIRIVPVTISCSTLLKRLKYARGHTLFSFSEEIDTLRKTNGAGSWSSKYDVYRLGFDNGEWGQDYNSDQAESGVANVAYNWTMLGTNGAVRKLFKDDNIENGLSSRILVAQMPDASFSKITKFRKRTEAECEKIEEATRILANAKGEIKVPRMESAMNEWLEKKRIEALKDDDRVKDTYRRRAAVIGFRCGIVYYLLSLAKHETKRCVEFAVMMAEYCLEQQMELFGEQLRKQITIAQEEAQRVCVNHNIFDGLPNTFSMDDLRASKPECSDSGLRNVIMRWKANGWIMPTEKNIWTKCPTVPRPTSH